MLRRDFSDDPCPDCRGTGLTKGRLCAGCDGYGRRVLSADEIRSKLAELVESDPEVDEWDADARRSERVDSVWYDRNGVFHGDGRGLGLGRRRRR